MQQQGDFQSNLRGYMGGRQIPGAAGAAGCRRHLCDKAACKGQNTATKNPPGAVSQQGCGVSPSCHRPLGKASLEGEKCEQ